MTTHSQSAATLAALATVAALVAAAAVPLSAGAVAAPEPGGDAAAAPALASTGSNASSAASTASEPTLVVDDATVDPDGTATQRIALTDAPDGLAGFELTLELESDVATVAGASYPDHFGMTTDPVVGADSRTVTVEAVDLTDEIGAGASDVTLATLELEGVEDGATELRVTEMQIDADGGDAVDPSLEAGTVTVGGADSAAGSGDSSGSSAQDGTGTETASGGSATDGGSNGTDGGSSPASIAESVPGFTGGVAIAAIAVLAATIARRT
ncbi:hypothetical protein [Halopiger thermotolerans]